MTFYVGEERTFTGPEVDSVEHPIVKWVWNYGDGTVSFIGQIGKHTYVTAGTYNVSLTTTNDCGATCTETQQIIIEPVPECDQEFRAYDKQGNPIADGWTCVAEIYEEDGETLQERRTAPVVNGVSVISVIVGRYVRAWAEKGEERTTGWSLGAGILCRPEPFKFYQYITCDEPTEHYASGRALLEHYDTDSDGVLTQQEAAQAVMDGMSEVINSAETIFVANCWETYGGVINAMCPSVCPKPSCAFTVQ